MWNQSKPVPRATVRIKHALGSRFAAVTPPHPVAGSPDPISTGLTQLLRWMSGGGTVQQGPALQPINRRRVRSALSDSTPGWRSGCRSVLRCPKSLCPGRNGEGGGGGAPGCHSDRNLIGGASDPRHLPHPASLRFVGGTLRQCRAGISHSGPGRPADWVTGRGRGGAGRGGGEGPAAVGPAQRFHLDGLIPDDKDDQNIHEPCGLVT